MRRTLLPLLAACLVVNCADGDGDLEPPGPESCTITPTAVTVPPQSGVTFDVACDGRFEFDDDAVGHSWSPDGQIHTFDYTASELPGEYTVTVYSPRDPQVRASATVTVEALEYPLPTDLVWAHDLDNGRVWIGLDETIVVENGDGILTYLDAELNMLRSYDGWRSFGSGTMLRSPNDADIFYMIGRSWNFRPSESGDVLTRFRWRDDVVERFYQTGTTPLSQPWSIDVSQDETLVSYWTVARGVLRELQGTELIFEIVYHDDPPRWTLHGRAYPDLGPDREWVFPEFTGVPSLRFSPDGSIAALGDSWFVDTETGEVISAEPFDPESACIDAGISLPDCPTNFPIPIDHERLVVFGWPNGRPAVMNFVNSTVEVFPPEAGLFDDIAPEFVGYALSPNRESLYVHTTVESVMLDLTTDPISARWRRTTENPVRRSIDAMAPDGSWIAVIDYEDPDEVIPPENLAVLDTETGEVLHTRAMGSWSNGAGVSLLWSPDGERLRVSNLGDTVMYSREGDPLYTVPSEFTYTGWIGGRFAAMRRNVTTRNIEAIEFRDVETFDPDGEPLVLDFGTRESRFLDDAFYANADGSLLWIASEAMAEGGMAFNTATGAWRDDIQSIPDWAREQLPPEQPLATEPTEVCTDGNTCQLRFACGAWDPSGRYMVEAWNEGVHDVNSDILAFRIVDNTGTPRRDITTFALNNCDAIGWSPTDALLAVVDGTSVKVFDVSNPLGQ